MLTIKKVLDGDFQIHLFEMQKKNAEVKTSSTKREICDYYTP